jgi:hypothetical protein
MKTLHDACLQYMNAHPDTTLEELVPDVILQNTQT